MLSLYESLIARKNNEIWEILAPNSKFLGLQISRVTFPMLFVKVLFSYRWVKKKKKNKSTMTDSSVGSIILESLR